ncbi:MAG: PAS domain-containing protein [Alphaproteobacteria bacterium]|nr:PAS domain-containing protein [Alphaproteobacteria bacterium SS10]
MLQTLMALGLMTPLVLVLLVLVAWGEIGLTPAGVIIGAVFPGMMLMLWVYGRQLQRLSSHLTRLVTPGSAEDESDPEAPTRLETDESNPWLPQLRRLYRRIAANDVIFDAIPDPVLLLDAERRITQGNAAAIALFGHPTIGRDITVALRNPDVLQAVDGALAKGEEKRIEFALTGPVPQIFEARVTPFGHRMRHVVDAERAERRQRIADGKEGADASLHQAYDPFGSVMLTLHDITAVRRSEQMRADFVANASHELRTPLASLLGFIETLRGPAQDDGEARGRFLGIMADQASRMAKLVEELLSLSRIETDEHRPPTDPVDMGEVLQRVAAGLELRAAGRKMKIELVGEDDLPPMAGDGDQLAQVFQNLIDNAITYADPETSVTVTAKSHEPASAVARQMGGGSDTPLIEIAVQDRGPGIPREHLPRLTERFYRVDPARSRAAGGTGLGLAIVKHIINRHRGRLSVDSVVDEGSTFTIYLPALEFEGDQKAAEAPPDSADKEEDQTAKAVAE